MAILPGELRKVFYIWFDINIEILASFQNISQFVTDNDELKFPFTRSGNNVETTIYI